MMASGDAAILSISLSLSLLLWGISILVARAGIVQPTAEWSFLHLARVEVSVNARISWPLSKTFSLTSYSFTAAHSLLALYGRASHRPAV